MDLYLFLTLIFFIGGYVLITLEHKLGTHKSAIALALAGILWLLVAFSGIQKELLGHVLEEAGTEVFGIVAFLLAAMALVEILIHYRFFDFIQRKLSRLKVQERGLFSIIALLTFFLSAILDNLTITIVMIQIARRFYSGHNLLVVAAGIVVLANAGGAWSPIGDVTTIMLWLAHKFSALEVITQGFIPSAILGIASAVLLRRQVKNTGVNPERMEDISLSSGERAVIALCLISFSFPLFMNLIGLPPYIGLLFGLGLVWILIEYAKKRSKTATHLEANIEELLRKTDISSIQFFIGILLAVSALKAMGTLEQLSHFILGEHQEIARVIGGNIVLGLLSAIVDNVPLTALAIDIIKITDPAIWVLLAFTVGTGGSFLVIGSVAGVVAMGMVKELTFGQYVKIASIPVLFGYACGVVAWLIQYQFIR